MKKVITYGTYDLFHHGHVNVIKRAKELGDYLIVGISTDEFNEKAKGKDTYFNYEQRKIVIQSLKYVDEIIPEENWQQKIDDIKKHNIDVFVIGDDWKGKFDFLKEYCEVVYLKRTKGVSSTKMKHDLHDILLK